MRVLIIFCVFLLLVTSFASPVFDVEGSLKFPRGQSSLARVILTGANGRTIGLVREDGTFVIHSVSPGVQIVDVENVDYQFPSVKLEIDSDGKITASLHTVATQLNPAQKQTRVNYPLSLAPIEKMVYFTPRDSFDAFSLLKQPTTLMMLVTLVMVFVVPRMMGNMSDDEKREMAAMQSNLSLTGLLGKLENTVKETTQATGEQKTKTKKINS